MKKLEGTAAEGAVSKADLIALAGAYAVRITGGPAIQVHWLAMRLPGRQQRQRLFAGSKDMGKRVVSACLPRHPCPVARC